MNRANQIGSIRTYLGRRCKFDMWEPSWYDPGVFHKAVSHDEALTKWGGSIKRAGTYKALNRLIQGTAADQTKKAMVDCYAEGLLPMLTVHDELCFNIENDEQVKRITES